MAHRVEFRQAAVDDLTALYERIAAEAGRARAGAYIDRIEAVCMGLETFPERGTVRNHLYPGLRIIGFERSASIAFVVQGDLVDILRILPRGMDFPHDWDD
ncbi:type II toxin-antitoxin system RelE/ParE family toxin (plasmid) [Rhizobium sp. CB3171]|uniref:type II toxin-antitoxin system RelE/ParE family toxin n=1 Tax=Rhizobium sp. CB3171 TaxID=3039157 RepID=UPI0024B0ECA2|nr:type II toxin-antitoxin system RelE/ParE family toxin [Rhizobium sp. CB3171]WFU07555.1 type II toxin-antitoxin system RelE/ParE family toxin [Rhizobium sp. CB3171]